MGDKMKYIAKILSCIVLVVMIFCIFDLAFEVNAISNNQYKNKTSGSSSSIPSSNPPSSSAAPSNRSSAVPKKNTPSSSYVSSNSTSSVLSSSSPEGSSTPQEESTLSLPEVSEEDISLPHILASNGSSSNNLLLGIIAWCCIGLGIIIVSIVLLSNKKSKKNYVPRKRYQSQSHIKRRKSLLPSRYYRNIKRK